MVATANERVQEDCVRLNSHSPSGAALGPIDLATLSLDDAGVILHCSQACEHVFGYRQDELAGRHISALLPALEDTELVMEDRLNSRLAFLCRCAIPFLARRRDGSQFSSELFINRLGSQNVVVLVRSLETGA